MNTFFGIFLYVLIGSFIAVSINNDNIEECGENMEIESISYFTFGWPSVFPAVIMYEGSSIDEIEVCDD